MKTYRLERQVNFMAFCLTKKSVEVHEKTLMEVTQGSVKKFNPCAEVTVHHLSNPTLTDKNKINSTQRDTKSESALPRANQQTRVQQMCQPKNVSLIFA